MSPNVHFLIYFLYWIFAANIWGIYVTRRVSVRPSGAGSGKVCNFFNIYIYLYWIFFANIWGIYVTRRVSVRPSGAGSAGKCTFVYIYICIGYNISLS